MITGDYGTLDRWIENFGKLDSPNTLRTISLRMGDRATKFIRDGFKTQADPFGNPWAPKVRPDGRKILYGADDLLNASWVLASYGPTGFVVMSEVKYALPHQFGAKRGKNWRLPRRPMTPDHILPNSWIDSFDQIYASEVMRVLDIGW